MRWGGGGVSRSPGVSQNSAPHPLPFSRKGHFSSEWLVSNLTSAHASMACLDHRTWVGWHCACDSQPHYLSVPAGTLAQALRGEEEGRVLEGVATGGGGAALKPGA